MECGCARPKVMDFPEASLQLPTHRFAPMPPVFPVITSPQNARLKNLVRLRDARHRRRSGYFLIEGEREVARALATGWPLTALFFCPDFFVAPGAMDLVDRLVDAGVEAVQVAPQAFSKIAYREGPDGFLLLAPTRHRLLEELSPADPALLVVVESVEKPGNLGALMRTANAAGADAVIVCDPVCDPFSPNAIRASQGAFFDLPLVIASASDALAWLNRRQIQPVATSPAGSELLWEVDLATPVAVVFGAESTGLRGQWFQPPGRVGKLPIAGITDSLNVGVAAGIVLFEAIRQRQQPFS